MGDKSTLTKLRGLPYDATEEEIANFFRGFETSLIHICRRDGERPLALALNRWAGLLHTGSVDDAVCSCQVGPLERRMWTSKQRQLQRRQCGPGTTRTCAIDISSALLALVAPLPVRVQSGAAGAARHARIWPNAGPATCVWAERVESNGQWLSGAFTSPAWMLSLVAQSAY